MGKLITWVVGIITIVAIILLFLFGRPRSFLGDEGMTLQECFDEGGLTRNFYNESCDFGEENIGNVTGFVSPHMCCVPRELEEISSTKE